jgi:HSP20 family protein
MTTMAKREKGTAPRFLDWLESELPLMGGLRLFGQERAMRCEEFLREDAIVVRAELPGFDPEKDIEVTLHDRALTIAAERRDEREEEGYSEFFYGKTRRTLAMPAGVDGSAVSAAYRDGILEVTVKLPPAPEAKQVKVPIVAT